MRHRDFVTRSEPYSRLSHGAAPRYNICANPLFFAVRHQGSGTNGRSDIPPCVPLKLSICVGAGHLLVLRLSEGQMSDFKGAAPMVKPFRTHKPCSAMKNTMPTGFAMRCRTAALLHASRESPTEKGKLHSTGHSTKAAIKSEPCSASSKTGDLFTPPPAHAPTLSFQQS